jgi:hypothetical protein
MPPARKRPKRVVPFVASHELQYGVRAVERDESSGEVASVLCMFCAAFGREDDPRGYERQRARTQKAKYWGGPNFRTDNYKSHLAVQHPARWAQYQALTLADKQRYFEAVAVLPKKAEASHPRRSLEPVATAPIPAPQVQRSAIVKTPIEAGSAPESVDEDDGAPGSAPVSPAVSVSSSASTSGREDDAVEEFESPAAVAQRTEGLQAAEVEQAEVGGGVVGGESGVVSFLLDRNVVNVALGDVLANVADGEVDGLFQSTIDCRDTQDQLMSDGTAEYRAVVRSVEFFRRVVELAALGLTFDQIATVCQAQWGGRVCSGPRHVLRMARVAVGANLQALARIVKKSWAISLSLHSVDRRRPGDSAPGVFVDVRLRACYAGKIVLFHLLALPVSTDGDPSTAGDLLFATTAKFLQALHARWQHKVIGCSVEVVDPAASGTSSSVRAPILLAFTRRLEQQVPAGFVRVASARPSLDAALQRFFDSMLLTDGAAWQAQLVRLSAYLQRQMSIGNAEELSAAAVAPCPPVADLSWLQLTEIARWFDSARAPIQRLLVRRRAAVTPHPSWWIELKVALVVSSMAVKTRAGLQGGYTSLLSQQPQRISMLRLALAGDVGVEGPLPEYQRAALRDHSDMMGSTDGMFAVKPHSVVAFVRGMGSWSAELFDALSADERQQIIVSTAERLLDLVQGLQGIAEQLEEQGGSNTAALSAFPPVLPHQVALLHPTAFQNVIRVHQPRLAESFSTPQLAAIEMEHHDLRSAAASEAGIRQLLDLSAATPAASFDEAWSLLRQRWGLLADFCGGLATVFPSSNSDSSSCSSWHVLSPPEPTRALADFPLESRLQCQQFAALQALR